jgi:hypothetical protein
MSIEPWLSYLWGPAVAIVCILIAGVALLGAAHFYFLVRGSK